MLSNLVQYRIRHVILFISFFYLISCASVKNNQIQKEEKKYYSSWNMFHYDIEHTGFNKSKLFLPLKLDYKFRPSTKSISRISSPIISYNKIAYFGCRDHNLYAFDLYHKKVLWTFTASSWIDSSPVLFGTKLFFVSIDGFVYCLNSSDGKLLWKNKFGSKMQWSSPVVDLESLLLYVGSEDGYFYAIDIASGEKKWEFEGKGAITGSPAISEKNIYFGDDADYFYCVDKFKGELGWKYKTEGGIFPSPTVTKDKVIFSASDGYIYSLNKNSGNFLWKVKTENLKIWSSPATDGERIYTGANDGYLYCLDIETGKTVWKYKTNGIIDSSPALTNEIVAFGSMDGNIYLLNKNNGSLAWLYQTNEKAFCSPAIVDDYLLIGSGYDGNLWIFKSQNFNLKYD